MYLRTTTEELGRQHRALRPARPQPPQGRRDPGRGARQLGPRRPPRSRSPCDVLVASINRYLGDADDTDGDARVKVGDALTVSPRGPGTAWLLDGLWSQLGLASRWAKCSVSASSRPTSRRVLFALVANRAIDPLSKVAAAECASNDVAIIGLVSMDEDQALHVDIYRSARMPDVVDIVHAVDHALGAAEQDDGKVLYLGADRAGNMLKVIAVERDDGTKLAIHAMRLRRLYELLLREMNSIPSCDGQWTNALLRSTPQRQTSFSKHSAATSGPVVRPASTTTA